MILNYTTSIDAEQTIGEIQKRLSAYGVQAMMTEYDGPHVSAVSFKLNIEGRSMGFKMPCNWRAVREVFNKQGVTRAKIKHRDRNLDAQAIRTAWRVIKVWVDAQLTLVEVNMVTVPQVFLPYALTNDGRTLAEKLTDNPGLLLGPAS